MVNRTKMKYRAEYCQIVADWRKSGLSCVDYCNSHGYHPNTFGGWIKKMSREVSPKKSAKTNANYKVQTASNNSVLVPLKIEDSPHELVNPTFELRFPNGVSISMSLLPGTEDLSRLIHIYRPELCSR